MVSDEWGEPPFWHEVIMNLPCMLKKVEEFFCHSIGCNLTIVDKLPILLPI